MAGTLIIRDEVTWMPTGWIFDNVLVVLAGVLRQSDASLAMTLSQSRTEVSGGYCDLRNLGTEQFRTLSEAVELAYEIDLSDGPRSFRIPAAYAEYMRAFSTLKALLRTDPRVGERKLPPGTLLVHGTTSWSAVWWIFDLLLEQAAALLLQREEVVSGLLLGGRLRAGSGQVDLRELDRVGFGSLCDAIEFVHVRQTYAPDAYAPAFYALVNERTGELLRLLRKDVRTGEQASLIQPGNSAISLGAIGTDPRTGQPRPLEAEGARHLEEILGQQQDGQAKRP